MDKSHNLKELVISVQQLRAAERYGEAIELAGIGYETAMLEGDAKSALAFLKNQLISYLLIGNYGEMILSMQKFEDLCTKYPTTDHYIDYYVQIGVIYAILNRYEDAKQYLLKAIDLVEQEPTIRMEQGHMYSNMCTIFLALNEIDEAVKYGLKALKVLELYPQKLNLNIVPIKANALEALVKAGDFAHAKKLYKELQDFINDNPLERDLALLHCSGAWIDFKEGDIVAAIEKSEKALHTFEKIGDKYMIKTVTRDLIEFYKAISDKDRIIALQGSYIHYLEDEEHQGYNRAMLNIEWQEKMKQIKLEAYIDPLTKVPNRRHLEEAANKIVASYCTGGEHFGCIIFDIDHFKVFNDRYGHLVGDEIIKLVAITTNEFFKKYNATFARLGGDEFIALLKINSYSQFEHCVRQLSELITSLTYEHNGELLTIEVSIGGATTLQNTIRTFNEIYQLADDALYKVKQQGRNHYEVQK